jgi:hypothetical protein
MSKHENKPHHKSEGVTLAGSPAALIDLLIKDADLNLWATEHIVNEGPKHKQVLTALLLKRLYALLQVIEKRTDTEFFLQEGYELTKEKGGKGDVVPFSIPIHLGPGLDKKKVVKAVSRAPGHELLAYAMGLQVIEWAIKATLKSGVKVEARLAGVGDLLLNVD